MTSFLALETLDFGGALVRVVPMFTAKRTTIIIFFVTGIIFKRAVKIIIAAALITAGIIA